MASFADTIKVTLELAAKQTGDGFGKLKSDVAGAEGAMGKLKAAAGGLGSALGPALSGAAIGGGVLAVGKSLVDLGMQFNDAAIAASDAGVKMGTSAENASRWQEVTADLGVSMDAVVSASGRLNKQDPAVLAQYGIVTQDANERLIETIELLDSIPDSAKRAEVGSKLLGKGWQELAPLMGEVRDRMAEVSDAKLISDDEVSRAKRLRDEMDNLNDTLDDVKLSIGEAAAPIIAMGVHALQPAVTFVDNLANAFANLTDKFAGTGQGIETVTDGLISGIPVVGMVYNGFKAFNEVLGGSSDAADKLTKAQEGVLQSQVQAAAAAAKVGDVIQVAGRAYLVLAAGVKEVTGVAQDQVGVLQGQVRATKDSAGASEDSAEASKLQADAANAAMQAAKDHQAAIEAETKALLEQNDARRAAADANVALVQAQDDLAEFTAAADKATQEAGEDQGKLNDLYADAIDKATGMADAVVALQGKQAAANGTTQSASDKLDSWNGNMVDAASELKGPLQQAVLDYIGRVNEIPPEKLSEIQALIDEGKLAEAKSKLAEASAARTATITVDASTGPATQEIDGWIHANERKTVDIPVRAIPVGNARPPGFAPDGGVNGRSLVPAGLGAVVSPTAVAPPAQVVYNFNIPVNVTPLANKAEVGRAVADALAAFYGTSGTRVIRRAG